MDHPNTPSIDSEQAVQKKRGRPRKDPSAIVSTVGANKKAGRPRGAKDDHPDESGTSFVGLRIPVAEKAQFQAEADRLGISLTDLIKIRIGATSGLVFAMMEIEKIRRAIDHTAQEFAVVEPQLDSMWTYIQDSDRAINKLSDDVRAGELATQLLSDRLLDVARARDEAAEMVDRLEMIQASIDEPAQNIAAAVERLADMLVDLQPGA